MSRKVEIISQKNLLPDAFFSLEEARLRFERVDGSMSDEVLRLSLERGDGVAAVVHNIEANTLILVEQFRYSTYQHDSGWLWELPAGIVGKTEAPAEAMRRELIEETGYQASQLQPIHTFYLSPGTSSERIFLFYAPVKTADKVTIGGGLPEEHEEIRIHTLSVDDALQKLAAGFFTDAKTLIGLQWLKDRLPKKRRRKPVELVDMPD